MELKDKKVLLVGLGILGGGLSAAKFLLENGARLTITDLRDETMLAPTIHKLEASSKRRVAIKYTLGKHLPSDFKKANLIIFNPAVPYHSDWVKLARHLKKEFYNDYTFFLRFLAKKAQSSGPGAQSRPLIIGITGTRGKTTTATWASHLIPGSTLGGNVLGSNLYEMLKKKTEIYVLELSSFQLEYAENRTTAVDIAAFTNLYVDHMNRYPNFKTYRDAKFNIFANQDSNDALVINYDEKITKEILAGKPDANLFFISQKKLPTSKNGLYTNGDEIFYQYAGETSKAAKLKGLAPHEKNNLLMAMMVAHLAGVDGKEITKRIKDLPQPEFREQQIIKNKNYTIINDSAGTSPEATMAAIEKYNRKKNFVLICGGTNKELDFAELAKKIAKDVKPQNLFLLEGSATDKLIGELKNVLYISEVVPYESLDEILDVVSQEFDTATVVFSPGAASFEKFKNEFDRGAKFNKLAKRYFS